MHPLVGCAVQTKRRSLRRCTSRVTAGGLEPGSLRWALQQANDHAGFDDVVFSLPPDQTTITLQDDLTAILDPVSLDGTSQPGYQHGGGPIVSIDFSNTSALGALTVQAGAGGSLIRGIHLVNSPKWGFGTYTHHTRFEDNGEAWAAPCSALRPLRNRMVQATKAAATVHC